MKVIWLIVLCVLFNSPLQAQERKDITVTQLLSSGMTSSRQAIVFPHRDAQVVVSICDIMAGRDATGA